MKKIICILIAATLAAIPYNAFAVTSTLKGCEASGTVGTGCSYPGVLDDSPYSHSTTCTKLIVTRNSWSNATGSEAYPTEDQVAISVSLAVSEPVGTPVGTIVFGSGEAGNNYYEDNIGGPAIPMLDNLIDAGYRVIQRKWSSKWYGVGHGGMKSLSRRGAVMFQWIKENLNQTGAPFCATGNSAGSSEVAYALASHGLADSFYSAVLTSGPPHAELERACFGDEKYRDSDLNWFKSDATGDETLNARITSKYWDTTLNSLNEQYCSTYGGIRDGCGDPTRADGPETCDLNDTIDGAPCNTQYATPSSSSIDQMRNAGILGNSPDLDYPLTKVAFLFGNNDCNNEIVPLGLTLAEQISARYGQTPIIKFVADADHKFASYTSGAVELEAQLKDTCRCVNDINKDGFVSPPDLGAIEAEYSCPVGTGDASCDRADYNRDGTVDPLDRSTLLTTFGQCKQVQ